MLYPFKILGKRKFLMWFFNAFVENLCIYMIPFVLSFYTGEPFTQDKFRVLIIALLLLHTVRLSTDSLWTIYATSFVEKYKNKIKVSYFKRLYNMRMENIDNTHNGFIKNQIDIVANESANFLRFLMSTVNGFTIALTIFLYQVFNQDKVIFLIIVGLILFIIVINISIGKLAVKIQRKYNELNSEYNASYVDFLQNIKTTKRLRAIDFASDKIDKKFDVTVKPFIRMKQVISLRSHGISFLIYVMYFIILFSLYFQMKNGANVLSYIIFYVTIFQGFGRELIDLSAFFANINSLTAACRRLEEIIKEEKIKYIDSFSSLELIDVKHQYKEQSNTIIEIDNFKVKKNDKVSIIGESGQGKTTLLNIISKDINLKNGKYLINGKKTDKLLDMAFVSQETDLFDLSIRDNLCLGKSVSDEKLITLINEAGLSNWYQRLTLGLDTVVGEQGLRLSTGQKQRLNFIRSIILDKDIYILDEPTSNLDEKTEKLIIDMINKYLKNKTVIIVSHRPDVSKMCNKLYFFDDNKLSEIK